MKSNSMNGKRPDNNAAHRRPQGKRPQQPGKHRYHGTVPQKRPNNVPHGNNPNQRKQPAPANRPQSGNVHYPNSGNNPNNNRTKKRSKPKYRINVVGILTLLMIVMILVLVVVVVVKAVRKVATGNDPKTTVTEVAEDTTASETEPEATQIDLDIFDGIYSQYAVIMDTEDGSILKGLNEDTPAPPASVTKMMTVLVALENIEDIHANYTMPSYIYDLLYGTDLSTAGFENGETVTYQDLLYGTMMRSGAECCLGLADSVSGGEEAFVAEMNAKAEELGMTNTHFMNCTGEHDVEHYSTVHDMAILLRYGLQNDTFRTLIITSVYYSSSTDVHPDGLTFYSTFLQTLASTDAGGATIMGGKTGFTTQAGQCLASFADVNGHEYILVTFGASLPAGTNLDGSHLHTDDAVLIYSRLYAYLTGGPTPTPRVAETVATTTTTVESETDENGDVIETTTTAATTESTAATTTEATTDPDTTYITFG